MEFDPRDQDIIRLLTRLKDVQVEYPESMFVARRQGFLKQMAGGKRGIRNTKFPARSPAISTLLETVLLVAIIAEAGIMTYFYRQKLADFFRAATTGSRVEEATPPPAVPTSPEVQVIRPTLANPSLTAAASPTGITGTVTSTPVPGILSNDGNATPGVSINSTPVPRGNDNGNNGHHYGQTPKPERTKENNDKPTKDKPPKDKPTTTK